MYRTVNCRLWDRSSELVNNLTTTTQQQSQTLAVKGAPSRSCPTGSQSRGHPARVGGLSPTSVNPVFYKLGLQPLTTGFQVRPTLVLDESSPLLAPLMTEESKQPPKPAEDRASDSETPVRQVTPLLGTTPRENIQLQHRNSPDDISDVLGTHIYQGYVETPLQNQDGIVVNQPKRFLPLAEEAKRLAEEIRIEKLNKQWVGILREQLLNQSFTDQLNSSNS